MRISMIANKRPWGLNDPKAETFSVIVNVK